MVAHIKLVAMEVSDEQAGKDLHENLCKGIHEEDRDAHVWLQDNVMDITDMSDIFKEYLDGNEDQLESDGFLPGQDVTLDQAKALFEDLMTYIKNRT